MKRALLLALLLPSTVLAQQEADPAPKVRYQRLMVYDFEPEEIESGALAPDYEWVQGLNPTSHSLLIRVREDFRDLALDDLPQR